MAVDASRGARRAASAASSRPSSAEAEGTRRAPLREVLSLFACTSGVVPATRGARLGRPVGSPRRARRAFTDPRHATRAGGSRCACVAMVRRARAFHVCVSLADSRSKTFSFADDSGKQHPRQKTAREASGAGGKERGGRGGDARVPRDDCDGQLDDAPSLGSPACFGRSSPRHDHHARPHGAPAPKSLMRKSQSRFSRDTSAAVDGKLAPNRVWCVNGVCDWRRTVIGP